MAPYTGGDAASATSLAALSWNDLMTLVAADGDGQPPIEPGEFDPLQPLTAEQCSFATPVAPEASSFGLAYATVPEPFTTALGVDVVAILTALRFRFARRA